MTPSRVLYYLKKGNEKKNLWKSLEYKDKTVFSPDIVYKFKVV